MAIIPQPRLFGWEDLEGLGDLERLRLVLENMPDEALMRHLERERGWGRDDYPIRAMWNSILAGVVYQHPSIESLRRELSRNGQLRDMCGFKGDKVPPSWAYSRFLTNLFKHQELVDEIFENLVEQCYRLLPDFGRNLALDGKPLDSHARRKKAGLAPDGRRDLDAQFLRELPEGTPARVLVVVVLTLGDRPGAVVLLGPERPTRVHQQDLDPVRSRPVQEKPGAPRDHVRRTCA